MIVPFSRRRFLASCGAFFAAPSTFAQDSPTATPWPKIHKPKGKEKIITIQKGDGSRAYIYHTRHFELRSLEALSQRHLEKFATVAESVPDVMAKIPMSLLGMPTGGRAKVLMFPNEDSFVQAGGIPGAAGFYNGRREAIMLRADSFLKPPPPAGSKLPPKADYALLVHEFVHLCMHRKLAYLPTWFIEGVAEYIAAAHENDGVYRLDKITSAITKRVKRNLPNDKDQINLPSVSETMSLTPKTWRERVENGDPADSYRMYGSSLLIVHTLFNGGEKRRTATREYLNTLRPRARMNERTQKLIPLNERDKLQQRIAKFWRPRGLRIRFFTSDE